jgi:integrase
MQRTDAIGRPLNAANTPGAHKGRPAPNKGRKFPGEVLTADEMEQLLDAALHPASRAATNGWAPPSAARNHAIMTVLWRCGLRSGELRALYPHDVNLPARTIRVPKSKTPAGLRTVGIDDIAAESLERWLSVRAELGVGDGSPVFCTTLHGQPGRPLGGGSLPDIIKRAAKQAGIAKRVHAHGLRHTFATEALRENIALPVVSRMLGHADTQITHRYIDHTLSPLEAIDVMQRRAPAAAPVDQTAELAAQVAALRSELTDTLATLVAVTKPA